MSTLGEDWKRQVPLNVSNRHELEDGISRREQAAVKWIEGLQQGLLMEGIMSCVSRGSDSLALPFPTEIVASAPLRSFMDGLHAKGLLVDVALNAASPEESLLLLTPR